MTAFFNATTGTVHLPPDATDYELFHESAHQEQYQLKTWLFRAWMRLRLMPLVGWLLTCALEYDAYRRARTLMSELNIWTKKDQNEARQALLSYVKRKENK